MVFLNLGLTISTYKVDLKMWSRLGITVSYSGLKSQLVYNLSAMGPLEQYITLLSHSFFMFKMRGEGVYLPQ